MSPHPSADTNRSGDALDYTASTSSAPPSPPRPGSRSDSVPPMRDKFIWTHHLMLPLLPHLKDGAQMGLRLRHSLFVHPALSPFFVDLGARLAAPEARCSAMRPSTA
eukprot:scaffold197683_cov31-Tisochrysis_lutea.AAC.9